jgi:beta-N-acetylhexosaminidase
MGSLETLADAVLLPGYEGTRPPDWVLRRAEGGLGGVTLYAHNVPGLPRAAKLLREAGGPRFLVAIDEEGGDVTRLDAEAGSAFPGNLALGAADDPELTRSVGRALGARLLAAGVNFDMAPVADVNTNPANPVIGVRSFGSDPEQVAAHTVAMVEGLQAVGVAACVKHFPGHGDTDLDSHLDLPAVNPDGLDAALVPFRAAIRVGVRAVMTAHLLVPGLDDDVPATLSRRILTGLLREELGFDGLVVTDALEMGAIAATWGPAEAGVLSIAAGADALCLGRDDADEERMSKVAGALVEAVRTGRLSEARLAEAAGRVAAVGTWAHPGFGPPGADPEAPLEAARRALAVEGDVWAGPRALVVELEGEASVAAGPVPWGFAPHAGPETEVVRVETAVGAVEAIGGAGGRPVVVVVRDPHRHDWMQEVLTRLPAGAVVVDMGWPAGRPEGAAGYVRTFGAGRVNAAAAAEVLGVGRG